MHRLKVDLTPKIRVLEIPSLKGVMSGIASTGMKSGGERRTLVFRGKGLEFEKYREFVPGDDALRIDWKASLRAHKLLIRVYTEEQNKDVVFFLDASSSMCFGTTSRLKIEYAIELINTMLSGVARSGDNIGLAVFKDKVIKYIEPSSGLSHQSLIVNTLMSPQIYEGNFNLSRSLTELVSMLKRPAIIVIVSDFIGLGDEWEKAVENASSRVEINAMMIADPADLNLPEIGGSVAISDPYSKKERVFEPAVIAGEYSDYNKKRIDTLRKEFNKTMNGFLVLRTDEDFAKKVLVFFMKRARL